VSIIPTWCMQEFKGQQIRGACCKLVLTMQIFMRDAKKNYSNLPCRIFTAIMGNFLLFLETNYLHPIQVMEIIQSCIFYECYVLILETN
jgi:hypothetical protein